MAKTVHVTWKERNRDLPTEMILTDDRVKNYQGIELHGFWMPNIYATPPGAHVWYLQEQPLSDLQDAQTAFVEEDMSLLLVDAYRSYEYQKEAQKRKPGLVISPERSYHTKGLAVDVRLSGGDQETLEEVMKIFGWKRTVSYEPWHFDHETAGGY